MAIERRAVGLSGEGPLARGGWRRIPILSVGGFPGLASAGQAGAGLFPQKGESRGPRLGRKCCCGQGLVQAPQVKGALIR